MIRCLIVDDEQHAIDVLKHYVEQCDLLELMGATTNAVDAMNIIASGKIDLLFQDIHMPEISGLELIKAINNKCHVILTTAYKQYALEGFDLGVIDYLLKPISYPRFMAAVQKASEKINTSNNLFSERSNTEFMYVKTGLKNNVVKINFDDIDYIESLKNYAAIHHNREKTVVYLSMKELEATLPVDKFFRIHKSFIISFQRITRIEGSEVILLGDSTRITIGESYKEKFWDIIKKKTLG